MIEGASPAIQGLLGGCWTWFMTALGAAIVFLYWAPKNTKLLDCSLGFAAGVMTAASFWSLLAPALSMATASVGKTWSWAPVAAGFLAGAGFVYGCDKVLKCIGYKNESVADYLHEQIEDQSKEGSDCSGICQQKQSTHAKLHEGQVSVALETDELAQKASVGWRRVMLLIVAIVIHNIPEGAAVGLAFGAIGSTPSATYGRALMLALGMGIQNLPEGMAVSLPLAGFGYSRWKAFFYGQLSGVVEPVAALTGAAAIVYLTPVLPYALAFAAGSMFYVVFEDIVPAGREHGHGKLCTAAAMLGFVIMMCLDVALG